MNIIVFIVFHRLYMSIPVVVEAKHSILDYFFTTEVEKI